MSDRSDRHIREHEEAAAAEMVTDVLLAELGKRTRQGWRGEWEGKILVALTLEQADALYRAHPFGCHSVDGDVHWAGRLAIKAALDLKPDDDECETNR